MTLKMLILAVAASGLLPGVAQAQNTGRVECARSDDYIYLYSSITTLEVRRTLQCGEIVQIVARGDGYCAVRTSKGDTGYIPTASLVLLKDVPGVNTGEAESSTRERTPYDPGPKAAPAKALRPTAGFALANDTPIRLRLVKTLSSGTAHSGEAIEFEVTEDVVLEGLLVIARGSKVTGTVMEALPKKRFGRDGKVSFKILSVRLADDEAVPVRCYHEYSGDGSAPSGSAGVGVSLGSGKDAMVPEGTLFTVLIDGDVSLKRDAFAARKEPLNSVPAASSEGPQR